VDIPFYFGSDWVFVPVCDLLTHNIVPIMCIVSLVVGGLSYYDFKYQIKGTPELSFKITEIEHIDYEHLTFLTTYIIPLVCFNFESIRYEIVLLILLVVIGTIYIRTDLFYANPTLAILQFRIYKVTGQFRDRSIRNNRILICREKLQINDNVKYVKIDNRIYYAYKENDHE
jgi:hypothetical protein